MAASMKLVSSISLVIFSLFVIQSQAQLRENFYGTKCSNLESIVKGVVSQKFRETFVTVPATLRMFFHDCMVDGCDGSVLIASTPGNTAEKDFPDNLSLAGDGFDTVIKAKQAVERSCPNTVSCADILALATRDVVALAGGPAYNVELGRRDGRVSLASNCNGNLPKPTFKLDELLRNFAMKGLTMTDLVALSGAHTLGFAHCGTFANRIYGKPTDRTVNAAYANELRAMCPRIVDPTIAINMDPTTPQKFDNAYYQNIKVGKGLFTSDQILFNDLRSRPIVNRFASDPRAFNAAFAEAMRKLGRVGVKTGRLGEIRRDCGRIN